MAERIKPEVKKIADAHIKAKIEGKFDDPKITSTQELYEQLNNGKTFSELLKQIEIRNVSITSLIMAGDTFGHLSDAYKKGVYKGFKNLLNNKFEEGGEADSEREDEEREEERDEANERLEELMQEHDLPREVIEEYQSVMGREILDITDLPFSGRYDSEEDFAEDLVEQGAISNLSYYLEMTSLDMRLLAQEEADARVDDMSDDEILDAMDMEDEANEYNELKDEIDNLESDVDDLKSQLDDYLDDEEDLTEGEMEMREERGKDFRDEIDEKENELENLQHKLASLDTYDEVVDKAREQLRDVYYDDIHDELERDAVGYFVDNLGYAEEDLASNNLFRVDLEKLASDLSHDYTIIEHGGDVYVFGSYMNGGMTYAKGGVMELSEDMQDVLDGMMDKYNASSYDLDVDKQEVYFVDGIGKEIKGSRISVKKIMADGGSIYAKGGNLPSIEKRVAEVNAMIKEGNEKGLKVVDESQTWQSPMKYKPLKYSNGVLYGEYEELNLYKSNRGQGNAWETKKIKITKRDEDYGYSDNMDGYAQRLELTDIARMYRKALNHFNKYGWYGDGGYMAKGGATFDDKVKSIKKRLEGMSVAPKYRKEYGKTYDKSEALSAAKAIAGSMRAKEMSKKKS